MTDPLYLLPPAEGFRWNNHSMPPHWRIDNRGADRGRGWVARVFDFRRENWREVALIEFDA